METSAQFIIARQDATILKAAKELLNMYEERFTSAAQNSKNGADVYCLAKASQAFFMAEQAISTALIVAQVMAEQDALRPDSAVQLDETER